MKETLRKFLEPIGNCLYLFAIPIGAEALKLQLEPPSADQIKKKVLLCLRVRQPAKGEEVHIDENNVENELIFMELNK